MIEFKYPIDYSKVEKVLINTINTLKGKSKVLDDDSKASLAEWVSKTKFPEHIVAYDVLIANQDDVNIYLSDTSGKLILDMSAGS